MDLFPPPAFKLNVNIIPDKQIIFLRVSVTPLHQTVAHTLHQLDDVLPGAGEHQPRQVSLHADHPDVQQLPGQRLQHSQLSSLNVQTEVVDGGVVQG